jgi:hypothetical protein
MEIILNLVMRTLMGKILFILLVKKVEPVLNRFYLLLFLLFLPLPHRLLRRTN